MGMVDIRLHCVVYVNPTSMHSATERCRQCERPFAEAEEEFKEREEKMQEQYRTTDL